MEGDAFQDWLVDLRRDLHMHPELAHQEVETTRRVVEVLGEIGVRTLTFEDRTGVVGLLQGHGPGKTLGLRADIDALPLQEMNDVPYRSRRGGVMHACGHDAHTTIMLGVAKALVEMGAERRLHGTLKFIFQPAEERVQGAREMIDLGVLENPRVDCVVAGHMDPGLPVGRVGVFRSQGYASSDRFTLHIRGRGAHGGRPNESIDPIVAGAHFVCAVQSVVGRNIKPTDAAVISVGRFTSGSVGNIIPETADLEGTIRALRPEIREQLMTRLREISEGIERTFGVSCDLELVEGVPACVNDEGSAAFMYETASRVLGEQNVQYLPPIMGAEDFALFALQRPSAIIRLGCSALDAKTPRFLHSPHFDLDEKVLEVGVRVFKEAALRYLSP